MTEKQTEVYEALVEFIETNGYTPTVREFGKYIGISSPATVKYYLDILEEKRFIERINNSRRLCPIKFYLHMPCWRT